MKSFAFNLAKPNWPQGDWGKALCRVPALPIILSLALWSGQVASGVLAAGAAFSIGLVGGRKVAGSTLLAMLCTTGVMALSACVGTLSGNSVWLNPIVTALWGVCFAYLSVHDEDSGWIAMQGIIVLVIACGFPSHGWAAVDRVFAIVCGCLVQISIISFVAWGLGDAMRTLPAERATAKVGPVADFRWSDLFASTKVFSTAWRYAVRMAITLIIAVETGRALHIQNGYWLPMTTIIILKPDFYRTYSGAIQRVVGTLLGVILASLVTHWFKPTPVWLVLFVATFSFWGFYLVKVHPVLFSTALTIYVVFLIAFTGLPETTITGHRLLLTALGSALALASRAVGYRVFLRIFRSEAAEPVPASNR